MQNGHDLLTKILDAIGYDDDKETFIGEFQKNIYVQTFLTLSETLDDTKQQELAAELSQNSNDPEKLNLILSRYFPQQQIQMTIQNVSQHAVEEYLDTVTPLLSPQQKQNLKNIT